MKKVLALLVFGFAVQGCDDGDLVFEEINFDDVALERCDAVSGVPSDILYKLQGEEVLLLRINNLEAAFPDEPTPENEPVERTIDGITNQLFYRFYNGEASEDNFCGAIQSPTPSVSEEWRGIGGIIEIETTALKSENTDDGFEGGERITAMRQRITLRNYTLEKPNGSQTEDTDFFGTFDQSFTGPALNIFGMDLLRCPATNIVYKNSGVSALRLAIDPALLDTSILNTPKSSAISDTSNQFSYSEYAPGTDLTTFCSLTAVPATLWTGANGDAVVGRIEVTTTTFGSGFKHTIRLKEVTLQKGSNSYLIATDFLFGELFE